MDSREAPLTDSQYFSSKYAALTLYIFGVAGLLLLFVDWKKGLTLLSIATLALLATPFKLLAVAGALGMVAFWSTFAFLTKGRPLALVPAGLALAVLIPLLWYDATRNRRDRPKSRLTWKARKYSLRELIWDLSYGVVLYVVYRTLKFVW